MIEPETNIVAFKPRTSVAHHPKSLMERIYAAGSLSIRADDRATKMAATMLQALGFLVIEEILADGTPRRLQRGEARQAMDRPWRLSKPAFSGKIGVPDGGALPSESPHLVAAIIIMRRGAFPSPLWGGQGGGVAPSLDHRSHPHLRLLPTRGRSRPRFYEQAFKKQRETA